MTIKRALISVSDKTGVVEFAQKLSQKGIEILSTGGTAKILQDSNISVVEVSDYTGFPEMMDGRIKTLHPKIHGGILARPKIDDDAMQNHDIQRIDMVVVNLYPFTQTVADPNVSLANAIENIDIGGPTMLRAAAKNHDSVTVIVDHNDYAKIITEMDNNNDAISQQTKFSLAAKTFSHTAKYDAAISNYLTSLDEKHQSQKFPKMLNIQFEQKQIMRYGENPHQQAAFYIDADNNDINIANANQIQGKELSYNNLADADAALECVKEFSGYACVIVKHANPCGVAIRDNTLSAYESAFKTDPTSAFGGIIAFNQELDQQTAAAILDRQFVEVIIAPTITESAKNILATKPNIRVLETGVFNQPSTGFEYKKVNGGLLVQDIDSKIIVANDLQIVTKIKPSTEQIADLLFAWKVAKFVKSNAIVYAKQEMTIGVGAGQMSRVYSAKIAGIKAADENLDVIGSVMASDAFFPFRDGLDSAHESGVKAVIQPGGSMRDDEVISAADEHGIAMVFTGTRHFKH